MAGRKDSDTPSHSDGEDADEADALTPASSESGACVSPPVGAPTTDNSYPKFTRTRSQKSSYSREGQDMEQTEMLTNEDGPAHADSEDMATTSFIEQPATEPTGVQGDTENSNTIINARLLHHRNNAPGPPIYLPPPDYSNDAPPPYVPPLPPGVTDDVPDYLPFPLPVHAHPSSTTTQSAPPHSTTTTTQSAPPHSTTTTPQSVDLAHIDLDVERAETASAQEASQDFECTNLGRFNCVGTIAGRLFQQLCTAHSTYSRTKRVLGVMALVAVISLILVIVIVATSFEFVDYYQVALRQSWTGYVDRDQVMYPGCYVLGPGVGLLYFPSTSQTIASTVSVFTSDKLVIDVEISLQYFLRPEEIGRLHAKVGQDYHELFEGLMFNTVKNEATKHSLEMYRLGRADVEKLLHDSVRRRLGGTCCPGCCPGNCDNMTVCSTCEPANSCDEAYHADVDYFQMGKITIPDRVFERYMRQTILQIEAERELFIQTHTVELKETARQAQQEINAAAEIIANATAYSHAITSMEKSVADKKVQTSYIGALKNMYSTLGVTNEDHKLSLMMMRTFEDIQHNLYSYDYDKQSVGDY